MRILITGGAGFIGSYTARALRAAGHAVTVLDNFSPQVHTADRGRSFTWTAIRDDVELVEGDIRDAALLARVVPGFDAILHLAAETGTGQSMYDVDRYCEVNVGGTARLLETLVRQRGRVRRLVVASSRSIYGEGAYRCPEHGIVYPQARRVADMERGQFEPSCPVCTAAVSVAPTPEDAILRPASVYAVTKLSQEQLTLAIGNSLGIAATALRYQNVYGAGQSLHNPYTGILSIFSREMLAGRPIEIFEDGAESRDFVHVEDVARVNAALLQDERATGMALNVGSGRATTVLEVAEALAAAYATSSPIRVSGRFRAGDIRHNLADLGLLRRETGLEPAVAFAGGIRAFASWARAQLAAPDAGSSDGYARALGELEARGLMGGPSAPRGRAAGP
jgi:dTDP-L-rhamnose 4-epimerase